jgi:Amt family ammonium transporter
MLTSTALVMLMLLPGLALFYGGLVRAKNLLSVMSQVLGIAAIAILTWVLWNYSLAFGAGNALVGNLAKAGFAGIDAGSAWPTSSSGEAVPELVFAAFQRSFAAVTAALIVGALAERVRFSAMMLFAALWLTIVYAPLAHMVWASEGLLFRFGAIDFAGGTVVHVNAGIAGLVGVAFVGPRIGHLKEAMPPHSLALTMVGAGLLWVGWFGFNGGSALAANGVAASLACYGFVGSVKNRLRLDDSLDVFGIHGVGGIVGSIATAFVALPALGGHGGADYALGRQLVAQVAAVGVAIGWSAAGSAFCFALVRTVLPLRHARDAEREGLDIADHGERAYNY